MSAPWIPVLINHDHSRDPIGLMRQVGACIEVELSEPLTREQVFQIFGDAGFAVRETVDDKIKRFDILEFSLCPISAVSDPAASPPNAMATLAELQRMQRDELIMEIERYVDKLAGADRDAARYRWLRDKAVTHRSLSGFAEMMQLDYCSYPETFDATIDAARSEPPKP